MNTTSHSSVVPRWGLKKLFITHYKTTFSIKSTLNPTSDSSVVPRWRLKKLFITHYKTTFSIKSTLNPLLTFSFSRWRLKKLSITHYKTTFSIKSTLYLSELTSHSLVVTHSFVSGTADFIKKGTFSVHSFNDDCPWAPRLAKSTFFHEIPGKLVISRHLDDGV